MLIVIEGPDGAGKTTLAEQISRQTRYPIQHMDRPRTEEDRVKMYDVYMKLAKSKKNVILDRSWYSEIVYGTTVRKETHISFIDMYKLEEAVSKNGGGMIIYCTGPIEELWKRATTRGEDYITEKAIFVDICRAYDELMDIPHTIPVVKHSV